MLKLIVLFCLCLTFCLAKPAPQTAVQPSAGVSDDEISPEYVELQRGNSRLHRTLFMLDTTDFMKKARAFQQMKKQQRPRRSPKNTGGDAHQDPEYITVPKPTYSVTHDKSFRIQNQ